MTGKAPFKDFCDCLYKCAESIEDDLKESMTGIEEILKNGETIDIQLPFQKVKIYHYNEILHLMKDVKISIKKILYHDKSIRRLENTRQLSEEEIKNYVTVKSKSTDDLTIAEPILRKPRRRTLSSTLYTLSTWEAYMKRKEDEVPEEIKETNATISKRNKLNNKQKQKRKLVSTTFNDILDTNIDDEFNSDFCKENFLNEEEEENNHDDDEKIVENEFCGNGSNTHETCDDSNLLCESITKPRIVDIIYKKQGEKNQVE
ncbi:unnamed protein product [Phyllotreta striolata]|uniref:Uncharacterized protein n=1 Tax=Phyllotreta striolata TaxID=444603 RepID=A0A9N9TRR7_PHYSR|nr:unnamed protein product [Phyllotreta striolata]